ncbi:MAG: class I SAM-dependent methyltransferase [Chloroflexi bacterium]|nr:class I SAM-dependent methyltransferase [Chloroflexota bacterium]
MNTPSSKIQHDFDRLAEFSNEGWDHNSHYHAFLLKQLPAASDADALEIGCGTGGFSRLLAQRHRRVLALDLSPRMIEIARERSQAYPNIDFQVADVLNYDFSARSFGCIASIATLHHLPLESILTQLRDLLQPNGSLLVLDLLKAESLADFAVGALAMPLNPILKLLKTGHLGEPEEVRAAWEEHGRTDVYPTLAQVLRACTSLPKARVTRHFFWRYSLVWKKEEKN